MASELSFIEKLSFIENQYESLIEKSGDADVLSDPSKLREIGKEIAAIEPVVRKYGEYKKQKETIDEAENLLKTETDDEFRTLLHDETEAAKKEIEKIEEELRFLLLPKDINDDKNVIIEIRAGTGGNEAALFAGDLFRMYSMYAERNRLKIEVLNLNEAELGGIKEISFMVIGRGAYSRLKFESGVHRVQRVPETESSGRIHTSTVTVAVLPEAQEIEVEINPDDLEIDTYRSSGAGGQHVNKTESAIRITHKPTGIIVACQEERSQFKNRDSAMKMLRSKIYEQKQREQDEKIASSRKTQVGTGERSEKIRTYNFPQGRVTDHRVNLTLYKIDAILNGDIGDIIAALITNDQSEKLRAGV